jgi:anti-sigma B factor antagonist
MDVVVERHGEIAVVSVSGNIDATTAPNLATALVAQIEQGNIRLVADLSGVAYTSSAGLRALLGTVKQARQLGGDFRLAGVRPTVLRVLELSGFTSIIKYFPDVPGAVESFAG